MFAMPLSIVQKLCGLMYVYKKEKTMYIFLYVKSHAVSEGQEFRSTLAGWLWLRISHKVSVKVLTEGAVIWMLDWSWRFHFQGGSLTWLLAGSLLSFYVGISKTCVPPAWLPSEQGTQENEVEAEKHFMTHPLPYNTDHTDSPNLMKGETAWGYAFQEVRLPGEWPSIGCQE